VAALAAWLAPAGYGQFSLFVANGSADSRPGGLQFRRAFTRIRPASATFDCRTRPVPRPKVTVLSATGAGFTLSGPAPPFSLAPQPRWISTVTFSSPDAGSYSAVLLSDGVFAAAARHCAAAADVRGGYGSGSAAAGHGAGGFRLGRARFQCGYGHLVVVNQMTVALTVPAILVPTSDLRIDGGGASGTVLQPGQSAASMCVSAHDGRLAQRLAGSLATKLTR